jgi:hypothetical protein
MRLRAASADSNRGLIAYPIATMPQIAEFILIVANFS